MISRKLRSKYLLRTSFALLLLVLAFSMAGRSDSPAQAQAGGPYVSAPVSPVVFQGDLRSLPTAAQWDASQGIREVPKIMHEGAISPGATPGGLDPLVGQAAAAAVPELFGVPTRNFAGAGFTGVNPADPNGDVGPNHYIQMINNNVSSIVRIYDKAVPTPNLLVNTTLQAIWVAAGGTGNCAVDGTGDPIVLWDSLANRWFLSEFASDFATYAAVCIMISQTADPVAGGWFLYEFLTPEFPDYPKYAVWPDAYYMGSNESLPAAYAFDRIQMLAGLAATFQRFTAPALAAFPFQMIIPADVDGATAPPGGSPGIFMRHRDDEAHNPPGTAGQDFIEYFEFSVDFAIPANSTFTGPIAIAVAEFDSELCGFVSFSCFPKPGGGAPLDPLREVIMWRLTYRNFGTHQTLVGNFVTDVTGGNEGGIRWFELRNTGGGWTLFQEGTYVGPTGAPDGVNRWMGAIAMDGQGNIALGYSVSNATTVFPGIRYTGRLATDPAGAMPQGEFAMVNAVSSNSSQRWGDYSAMSIDPTDDCTFWYTNKFGNAGTWATQIASFAFDQCLGLASADLSISKTVDDATPDESQSIVYTLTVTNLGPDDATNVVVTDTLPAGVTWVSDTCGAGPPAGNILTWNVGNLALSAQATCAVTVTVNTGTAGQNLVNAVNVTGAEADPVPTNNNAQVTVTVNTTTPPPPGPGEPPPSQTDPGISKIGVLGPGQLGLPGEQITWTITVYAPSSAALTNIVVTDTFRSELRIDAASAGTGTVSVSGQTVTWTIPFLSAGTSADLQVVTTVLSNPAGGVFTNTAFLIADTGVALQATATVSGVGGLPDTGYPPEN